MNLDAKWYGIGRGGWMILSSRVSVKLRPCEWFVGVSIDRVDVIIHIGPLIVIYRIVPLT
ncbi:hypothetical protein ACRARG_12630 [Pseudooceanicola sp. C21-150M6]|uniref:hypothetical protein n=1 Tax=Pseudooceanicola sp. C21-150M6 TaxID=3434355 RepID=UPI003D7F3CB6